MQIEDLNERGLTRVIRGIANMLTDFNANADEEGKRGLLDALVPVLDELSEEDTFGTEGWEHAAGLEP